MDNRSFDPEEGTGAPIPGTVPDNTSNHGDSSAANGYGTCSGEAELPVKERATEPYAGMGKEDLLRFSQTPFWRNLRMACLAIFWLAWLALLAAVIALTVVLPRCKPQSKQDWWQKDTFYQIYLRSYYDSGADGIGDLKGLEAKLDYLYDANIRGLVVSSFYEGQSGEKDFGYEVTDHKKVDPQYGTLEDFDDLLATAHSKGLKIIVDFVPNYTGKNHTWFKQSSADFNRSGEYWNYYVWTPCRENTLPNNWLTKYGDPAWTYEPERGECYLHQFTANQPDLNMRSDAVKEQLEAILRFWLDKGVDGFRVNAPAYLFEDSGQRDEAVIPGCADTNQYNCFDHSQTRNRPQVYDMIHRWRAILDEYGTDRVLLTDTHENINVTRDYYGLYGARGADLPINYQLSHLKADCGGDCVRDLVNDWLDLVPSTATASWALGSQDLSRINSEMTRKRAELTTMLAFSLPGVPITYYGDELGMANGETPQKSIDPAGERDPALSRDPYRTPMQWENATYAGFMNLTLWEDGGRQSSPWLPVNDDYAAINVEGERSLPTSQFSLYSNLARMRAVEPSIYLGDHIPALVNDRIFSFIREFNGVDSLLVALNFGDKTFQGDIKSSQKDRIPDKAVVYLSNSQGEALTAGYDVDLRDVTLKPGEGAIFVWEYTR